MKTPLFAILARGLLVPAVAILALTRYNIFDHLSFVPQDHAFEIGMTAYFAILEILVSKSQEWLQNKFTVKVSCVFYSDEPSKGLSNNPVFIFPEQDVVSVRCEIDVEGAARQIQNLCLQIPFPLWSTPQKPIKNDSISIKGNNLNVNLSELVNRRSGYVDSCSTDVKISIIRNDISAGNKIIINPTLVSKLGFRRRFMTSLKCNAFTLKNDILRDIDGGKDVNNTVG